MGRSSDERLCREIRYSTASSRRVRCGRADRAYVTAAHAREPLTVCLGLFCIESQAGRAAYSIYHQRTIRAAMCRLSPIGGVKRYPHRWTERHAIRRSSGGTVGAKRPCIENEAKACGRQIGSSAWQTPANPQARLEITGQHGRGRARRPQKPPSADSRLVPT
ncbi:hypothetical protein SKAU_G00065300 [Synaphobranchus kaupii]|uniref:Uncharacterized protein n=1 Tax=Synaphobranchus kaupii TaxID=118154 RepID=A0A9Q1G779_SYNKA|nr:hypothetical protein SKAU_G00065300 [Synaphobranchus kaupii]